MIILTRKLVKWNYIKLLKESFSWDFLKELIYGLLTLGDILAY